MEKFYHASTCEYKIGKEVRIRPNTKSNFIQKSISNGLAWKDELIDKKAEKIKRQTSLFCFNNYEFCQGFIEAQGIKKYHIYEVEVKHYCKSPFCITNNLSKENSDEKNQELIDEYWNPTLDWNIFEYLTESVIVKKLITERNSYARQLLNMKLMDDNAKLKNHYA